jgi:hypothetical protein
VLATQGTTDPVEAGGAVSHVVLTEDEVLRVRNNSCGFF